jgi:hypothetical protein
VLHHFLPSARAEFGIGAVDVHPGQREVEVWLALGFVVGLEEPLGLVSVTGLEAGLLSGRANARSNLESWGRSFIPLRCIEARSVL